MRNERSFLKLIWEKVSDELSLIPKYLRIIFALFIVLIIASELYRYWSENNEWENAQYENNIIAYNNYLDKYPNGRFTHEARLIIEEKVEENIYNQIQSFENIVTGCERYLEMYPNGKFAHKVRSQIEEIYYKRAVYENTISAYEYFLTKNPNSIFSEKVRKKIDNIYSERHPKFKNVKKALVVVNQFYANASNVDLPFNEVVKNLLEYASIEVVGSNAKNSDFTIKVKAWGEAKGAYYGKCFLYTEASLTGRIIIEIQGSQFSQISFHEEGEPPSPFWTTNSDRYLNPSNAPFNSHFDSFESKFFEILGPVLGPNFLINASRYKSHTQVFTWGLINAFKKIRKSAVYPLINRLKDYDYDNPFILEALGKMEDTSAVVTIIKALEMGHNDTRMAAARYDTRMAAAEALGEIGDFRAIKPLIDVLNSNFEYSLGTEAKSSLEKITHEDFGKDTLKWKKWWDQNKDNINKNR